MKTISKEFPDRYEYPFRSKYIYINGARLHYVDEGTGEVILFVHGTPSWSFDFRNLIKPLSKNFRTVAADHIGFGLSDKPKDYNYSTQLHADTLGKFIESRGLKNITLVVHDFGGPIGLNYAIKNPDNIKRIIVLNSWLWGSEKEPGFIKFRRILKNPLLPFLYLHLNFSARFLMPSSFGSHKLTNDTRAHYTKPFGKPSERYGTLAFARSLLNDQDWFESLWQNIGLLKNKPVLFVWGMKDKFITPKYLEKFQNAFKKHKTLMLENAGHFPQEEESAKVTDAIQHFMKTGKDNIYNTENDRYLSLLREIECYGVHQ